VRINHNVVAVNAQRNLMMTGLSLTKSVERLSSGLRINRASDDAAGLSISEKLRAQIRGLAQAQRNAQDGISMIQTGEGSMAEIHDMLQRMRELAVEASNDTLSASDRTAVNTEIQALRAEIDSVGNRTQFNGKTLLDGSVVAANIQIGPNATDTLSVTFSDVRIAALGLTATLDNFNTTQSVANAQAMLSAVDAGIDSVSAARSTLGAYQNRLEHTVNNLGVAYENTVASESRIRDADFAEETVNFTKAQILQQSSTAILAQANALPQTVLTLLR
jgi:flagellin